MQPLGTKVYLLKRYSPSDSFCTFFSESVWTKLQLKSFCKRFCIGLLINTISNTLGTPNPAFIRIINGSIMNCWDKFAIVDFNGEGRQKWHRISLLCLCVCPNNKMLWRFTNVLCDTQIPSAFTVRLTERKRRSGKTWRIYTSKKKKKQTKMTLFLSIFGLFPVQNSWIKTFIRAADMKSCFCEFLLKTISIFMNPLADIW